MSTVSFYICKKKLADRSPLRPNAPNQIPDRNPPLQHGLEFERLIFTKYGNPKQIVEEIFPQAAAIRYASAICSDAIRFIGRTDSRQTAIVRRSAAGWAR